VKKMAITEDRLVLWMLRGYYYYKDISSKWVDLAYDILVILVIYLSQIRYSLVVILGLNSISGVQYKDMMIDR